jgi:beta-aspartyl-peptidase (threonine type)
MRVQVCVLRVWCASGALRFESTMKPALILHGGAWAIPDDAVEDCRKGIRRALEAGWKVLSSGGAAIDAVQAAIVILEDDVTFDAGVGAHLNAAGRVQLDAILMDGATLKAGAVAAVERVKNPILLARKVLEKSEHMMLVGDGAERFAESHGVAMCEPEALVIERERVAWSKCIGSAHAAEHHVGHESGTVGAVAIDRSGHMVAGTSTGGTCCKLPGRVGDSPLIGCGCYADQEAGGISCTGHGEGIMKIVMAKMAADLLAGAESAGSSSKKRRVSAARARVTMAKTTAAAAGAAGDGAQNTAQFVADACVRKLEHRAHTTGGLILLDREGNPGAAFNTPRMAYGFVDAEGRFKVFPAAVR